MDKHGFETVDLVAVLFFVFTWCAYFWTVNASRWQTRTITHQMVLYRQQWMLNMVGREVRMVDALIANSLQQGVVFFASTSILLIGGLTAGLSSADSAMRVLSDIHWSSTNTRTEWELKVALVLLIFIYAFFKFAWSYRLFNYVIIMIGAAPPAEGDSAAGEKFATKVAKLHAIGAKHFTMGLSSYFFALCAAAWFINAYTFIAATVWLSLVLYRRTFQSNFMKILVD